MLMACIPDTTVKVIVHDLLESKYIEIVDLPPVSISPPYMYSHHWFSTEGDADAVYRVTEGGRQNIIMYEKNDVGGRCITVPVEIKAHQEFLKDENGRIYKWNNKLLKYEVFEFVKIIKD